MHVICQGNPSLKSERYCLIFYNTCVCVLGGIISISDFIYVPHKKDTNYRYLFSRICHLSLLCIKAHDMFWGFSSLTVDDLPISVNSYNIILNSDNSVVHIQSSTFFFFSWLFPLVSMF